MYENHDDYKYVARPMILQKNNRCFLKGFRLRVAANGALNDYQREAVAICFCKFVIGMLNSKKRVGRLNAR